VKVVSAFPGCGKTHLVNHPNGRIILDSDSSNFSWLVPNKTRHPDWPDNYIAHIKVSKHADLILVSTHKEVRDALRQAGLHYTLVYPSLKMKDEFIGRYKSRGNTSAFVDLLTKNYESWISELMSSVGCDHVILQPSQYLSDVL